MRLRKEGSSVSIQSIAAPLGWMVLGGIITFAVVFVAACGASNDEDEYYDEG